MNLFNLFSTPQVVELRLLSEFPESTDTTTWKQAIWPNYQPILFEAVFGFITGQGALLEVNIPFFVTQGFYNLVGYGICQNGQCLFVGQLDPDLPNQAAPGQNFLNIKTILFPGPGYP